MSEPGEFGERGLPPAVDQLLRLSAAVTQRLNQRLHDTCNLSLAQYQFLSVAAAGPVTLGRLASALGCTRGNVTGLADRLIDQGLVQRRQDADDRRVAYVELTAAGRARLAAAGEAVRDALRGIGVESRLGAWRELLAQQAAALPPGARAGAGQERPYPKGGPSRQDRVREDRPGMKPGPAGFVRVAGVPRRVIVVRDDQTVRLGPGGPLAE